MANSKQLPHTTTEWTGYTLDELRYVRAYTAARMELNRERVISCIDGMRKKGFKPGAPKGLIGKVVGAFGYLDIVLIAWRAGRKLFRVTRAIKGK